MAKGDKIVRVLQIYAKLTDGYVVNKAEEAKLYGVNERSIQRDIDDIRNFLDADADRTGILNLSSQLFLSLQCFLWLHHMS